MMDWLRKWFAHPPNCPRCGKRLDWIRLENRFRMRDFKTSKDSGGICFWCYPDDAMFTAEWFTGTGWGPLTELNLVRTLPKAAQ